MRPGMTFLQESCCCKFYVFETLQMSIAESLQHQRKPTRGRPSRSSIDASHSAKAQKGPSKPIPNRSIGTDGYEHWREFCETEGQNPKIEVHEV